jgi:AsmA protein
MSDAPRPLAPAAAAPPRRRRWLRRVLIGLAAVVLLPVLGAVAFLLAFDPSSQRPRIEAAVEAATGRRFAIAGPVEAKLSLVPTIALNDVALANPEGGGFSRPAMLTARRVEVRLALLPLLSRRVEVRRVLLDGPDLLLERDAGGRPNWEFAPRPGPEPEPAPSSASPAPPAVPAASRPAEISLERLLLTGGVVTWRGDPAGPPVTLGVPRLALEPEGGAGGPLRLDGAVTLQDLPVAIAGELGPIAALTAPEPPPARPWPLRLALEAEDGGARLAVEGTVARPAQRQDYRLAVRLRMPDLARFARFVPDLPLPPLRDLAATATVADGEGGGIPAVSDLRLTLGESDLNALVPGLRLVRLAATLPRLDQPLALEAEGRSGPLPVTLAGTLGPPAALLLSPGAAEPYPLDLRAGLGTAAEASLRGTIADPRALTGVDLALALRAPDLAALAPLAGGAALPPLREVALQARVAERGPGFAAGAVLRDLSFASSAGDLAGALTYVIGTRQGVSGQLASRRLDLDALTAAPAPAPAAPASPPPPAPRRDAGRVIPEIPLPLQALRLTDSDLALTVGELRAGGRTYRDLQARAVVQDGRGRLDPLLVSLPGEAGRLSLRAAADVTQDPPAVQLAARSEGLDLAALQSAYGMPARATGRLAVEAELRGRGRDTRAVAATATGHLGLALTGGQLPAAMLENALSGLRGQVPGLEQVTGGRPLDLSCVAARLEAQDGIARARVLLAETGLGRIGALDAGGLSLRDETLSMRVNTDLRLPVPGLGAGGLRIRAPVPVTGTLAAPRLEWGAVAGSALAGEAANQAERALGPLAGGLLGALGGAVGGAAAQPGGGGPIPDCATALAMARGGRPAPAAPAAGQPAPAAPATPPPPAAAPPAQRPGPPAAPPPGLPRELQGPAQELLRRLPLPGFSR